MLPVNFLRHTSTYNLDLNGVKITAKVVERITDLMEDDVDELWNRLDTNLPIVGVDLKYTMPADSNGQSSIAILVLYVQDYCLLVKFNTPLEYYCNRLWGFLTAQFVCFLDWGKGLLEKVDVIRGSHGLVLKTCVNVSNLAGRVLRNKEIMEGCGSLEDLATKVGITLSPSKAKKKECDLDGNAFFYTDEEVKYAIDDAFKCYTIGTHLMKLNS